ncbi:mannose-6-phosphate isomerase-like [Stegodyphus dumicola]|uniref:mannose-6-phosphate isomerase-like n=1 Tax=Stegodyphus dumicola TaxID=202533 RepID=UPI0015B1FB80|nr:mannose-6-phosphate isomerase-like [Stegodyphus dumicola]
MSAVFKIQGVLKNYDWGKIGLNSFACKLYKSAFSDFKVNDVAPYAELWLGTHPSGPSVIPSLGGMTLMDWISDHPECLGQNITNLFDKTKGLPFLFKVLSVNKSLSIQAHPDKQTAVKLFKQNPDCYPDDNHKPEMAIALTDFEALCGFRPISEIMIFLKEIPEIQKVVGKEIISEFLKTENRDTFKSLFRALMTCPAEIYQPLLSEVVQNFKLDKYHGDLCKSVSNLFLRVSDEYPGDIGLFCIFFLNYLKLKCGEAVFLAANEPHAYLYGDCIECMACSDNVVRAGLTPKFRDVYTLCDILTYNCKPGNENIFQSTVNSNDPLVKTYNPPVEEFTIDKISLSSDYKAYALKVLASASILLVVSGEATYKHKSEEQLLHPGTALFISSQAEIYLNPISELLIFRAYCCN